MPSCSVSYMVIKFWMWSYLVYFLSAQGEFILNDIITNHAASVILLSFSTFETEVYTS